MHTPGARIPWITSALLAFGTSAALAQVDVELAFDPQTASPGQQVTLNASLSNLGSQPVETAFTVTIAAGRISLGPLKHTSMLAGGLERHTEVPPRSETLPVDRTSVGDVKRLYR